MLSKQTLAFAASISSASAAIYQGFNYGAQTDFATEFALAKSLVGTSGAFTSARLYTSIEQNTATTPSSAFEAAIAQDVSLLLGLWASAGQATIDNEIAAIKNAIAQYGTQFTSRVVGISVGSEDLYRNSPTGIINMSGYGANPADLVNYVNQVRSAIAGTGLAGVPVGHVDTWTAWVNGSNNALISAVDFLGMDAYPYFQTTQDNTIQAGPDLFFSAYDQTVAAGQGKPVWVTETGWPASGPLAGAAQPSTENAEYYWKNVACKLLGATNTWWYTLNDAGAAPSFGVTTGSSTPLYDLSCDASSSSSSSSSAAASSTASSSAVASGTTSSAVVSTSASTTAVASSAAVSSADVSSSAVVSSSAASLSAHESTASPSNIVVPVTSSAVPSQNGGGSPGALSSKAADSSISSLASASPSVYSSILASASSAAAASPTASYTSIAPAVGSGSSSTLSSIVSSTVSTGPASGTSSVSVASYTGGASTATLGSTGGIVAAIFALLAIF